MFAAVVWTSSTGGDGAPHMAGTLFISLCRAVLGCGDATVGRLSRLVMQSMTLSLALSILNRLVSWNFITVF